MHISYLAIVAAAVISFFVSTIWYIIFAKQRAKFSPAAANMKRPQPVKMLLEVIRNLILALVIAYLVQSLGVSGLQGAFIFSFIMWIGFPLILLSGSVIWEKVPWKLAAIHSGDWFIKLFLMSAILGMWR